MQIPATTHAIIIPTGRNGFCCVVPCGCLLSLCAAASTGLVLLLWRRSLRYARTDHPLDHSPALTVYSALRRERRPE